MTHPLCAAAMSLLSTIGIGAAHGLSDPAIAHGGPVERLPASGESLDCVPPAQRAAVDAAIRAHIESNPVSLGSRSRPLYPFVPLGGSMFADLLPPGYVDHAPGVGATDYSCGTFTYDGHAGTDIGLRSFEEQAIGVPVFSALPGTVVFAHDGEPDMNTCLCGQVSNLVIIDHGDGRYGEYWHLKNGSVAVIVGQTVSAGEQIGLAASSGNSAGPHLHFETRDQPGNVAFDPFGGPCSEETGWVEQPAYNTNTYVADFGFMNVAPWTVDGYPHRFPTTQQRAFGQDYWWWMQIVNLPPNSTFREIYIRPNGTTAFDSGDLAFNNPDFYRVSNYWFNPFFISQMNTVAGTWRIRFVINGVQVSDTPLIVAATTNPTLNRAPSVVSVAFDPADPDPGDALFARVSADLVMEDLDYDLVRFRYVWRINGSVVRDNVFAGRADALRAGTLQPGDEVEVSVTPNDGKVDGTTTIAMLTIASGCAADYNGDTGPDILDFLDFFDDFGSCENQPGPCGSLGNADFNGDTLVDILDFLDFLDAFGTGC